MLYKFYVTTQKKMLVRKGTDLCHILWSVHVAPLPVTRQSSMVMLLLRPAEGLTAIGEIDGRSTSRAAELEKTITGLSTFLYFVYPAEPNST
jgi:hypothetical protein